MKQVFTTEKQTTDLAASIAKYIVAGDIIRLQGDLGAGKSVFARAVVRGLHSKAEHIPSPTFTILQTYDDTRLPVVHVDLYRIEDESEVEFLELQPWIKHGVTLVEWPENAPNWFPESRADNLFEAPTETDNGSTLTVKISQQDDGGRVFELSGGKSWQQRLSLIDESLRRPSTPQGRKRFVEQALGKGYVITPVSADASFRSYWRVKTEEGPKIVMDSPPPLEDVKPVIKMTHFLEGAGVRVPHIYAKDEKLGYLLQEDFGDTTLLDAVQNKGYDLEKWYEKAVDILIHMALSDPAPVRQYSHADLWSEAARFTDWYLPQATGHATFTADRQQFHDIWLPLFDKIMDVPKTTTFWDYHAANLMVLEKEPGDSIDCLGVIDFQDARVGPVSYDLSMLLQDVRFAIPDDLEQHLIQRFVDGLGGLVTMEKFMESYELVNLQRTMKIIGGFTRVAKRDGKDSYLKFMPRCWEIVDRAIQNPATTEVQAFLARTMPARRAIA